MLGGLEGRVDEIERVAGVHVAVVGRGREDDFSDLLERETVDGRDQTPLGSIGIAHLAGVPEPRFESGLREVAVVEGVLLEAWRFAR